MLSIFGSETLAAYLTADSISLACKSVPPLLWLLGNMTKYPFVAGALDSLPPHAEAKYTMTL